MRTIVNTVDRLHEKYDFYIVTRDHDGPHDREQYKTVEINSWNNIDNAKVFYLSKDNVKLSKLRQLIFEVDPDIYYANSFFATPSIYLALLRKLSLIPKRSFIVAPCGELSDGALALKSKKKKYFIKLSKLFGLHSDIVWKASSELEEAEILRVKGARGEIDIAPDLPPRRLNEGFSVERKPKMEKGTAKFVFLSRVAEKKNLKWLFELIHLVEGEISIDVYGPIEDEIYWKECKTVIDTLPENVKVTSKGPIPYETTAELLLGYHFFVLPTLSENFGHVFLEALSAGCPLVISDRTPWLGLENSSIGWDIPLENPACWVETLNKCVAMESSEYKRMSESARKYSLEWLSNPQIEKDTVNLIERTLKSNPN